MRNLTLFMVILLFALPVQANEIPSGVDDFIKNPQPVGSGRMRVMMMDIYDATVIGPQGTFNAKKPFALSLEYHRSLKGRAIAERTMAEIRRQGLKDEIILASWFAQLVQIFPDVQDGTVLTGIYNPGTNTVFLQDGKIIGKIQDPDFGIYFFNIWLGSQTREPKLREQLLRGYSDEKIQLPCHDRICHAS